ncbi:Vegetative incompatibility protein HET-E-1 [Rhizoctonia solani AG-1 IB]|uniref:Vegetative incompatibility protein HET-E-1 n=1 Tax=Thanatephorus cucumeris (strain AG1-IB / isolate 7/3/14) TaxID=1108050 RepID=M5C9L0_THACB|nr:Vegetative incompatibility protein HET-E-1 [Rhizoctonia solani AG-1 IB]
MPLMTSIQDSLARSKYKWKKRLRLGQEATSHPHSVIDLLPGSTHLTESVQAVSSASSPIHDPTTIVNPDPEVAPKSPPKGTSSTWAAVSALLHTLEAGAEVFPPAKPVVSGLKLCVHALSGACQEREEYEYLASKLKEILHDLNEHMKEPIGLKMTDSVRRIYNDIEQELEMVAKKQERTTGRRLLELIEESDELLDCYRRIGGHFQRLTLNCTMNTLKVVSEQAVEARLKGMSPSMSAVFNSAEAIEVQRRSYAEGTRKAQIDLLLKWANTPDAGKTYWMNGMAGTGKTTVAYTVCAELEKVSRLGASFFCSRNIQECRQVKHIIPSIAYQLARFSLPFRCALDMVLEAEPDAHTRALNIQYQKLIVEPLTKVQESLPLDLIVVIDALDECESEDTVGQILNLLLSTTAALPIRFLISSRPEAEITQKITGRLDGQDNTRLVLHDLDPSDVRKDIEVYMRSELEGIPLTTTQWRRLLESCGLLFIFASTACRFVRRGHEAETLEEAVSTICSSASIPARHENSIDALYLNILKAAFERPEISKDNIKRIKDILEVVVCAIEPMTLDTIAGLLNLKSGKQVSALIQPLRSVLNVSKATGVVTTLHASFPDFMLSPEPSSEFCCAQETRHTLMAKACLQMVEIAEPRINICALRSSHLLDNDVEDLDKRVTESISPGLMYACRYWTTHLRLGEAGSELMESVRDFFSSRLLLWMEVMNLGKYMRYGTRIIQDAEKWCAEHKAPEDLIALANDSFQFVSFFASNSVSKSTPHIYVSMLPFWPRSRPISAAYMPRTSGLVRPTGTAIDRRQLALIATWKVSTRSVESMSLTADGGRLVAPSENDIEVYDTTTGESVLSLADERAKRVEYVAVSPDGTSVVFSRGYGPAYVWDIKNGGTVTQLLSDDISGIPCIAFSCNGSRVACGLANGDVYLCGLQKEAGTVVRLAGHTDYVRSAVFSPDGLHLASGSSDKTVRVWNVRTGQPVGEPLEGHTNWVQSVSYSDDGSRLASASRDMTIRIWDPQTGQTVLGPLTAHSHHVSSVSFSPGGAFIASGSWDRTIRVYDAHTGHTILGPLHGHTKAVNWVKYSPDGTRLYSCSYDGTIRIWNVQDRGTSDALSTVSRVSTAILSFQYSHSGQHIVSGSLDGTVHVWDARTGELTISTLLLVHGTAHCDYGM